MELNVLSLRPRTFNCQLEKVKRQKGYTFYIVNFTFFLSLKKLTLYSWIHKSTMEPNLSAPTNFPLCIKHGILFGTRHPILNTRFSVCLYVICMFVKLTVPPTPGFWSSAKLTRLYGTLCRPYSNSCRDTWLWLFQSIGPLGRCFLLVEISVCLSVSPSVCPSVCLCVCSLLRYL